MATRAPGSLDPIADLRRRLAGRPGVRRATRSLRSTVERWWAEQGLAEHPASVGKRIGLALLEQTGADDKQAGVLVLAELLGDELRVADVAAFASLFEAGWLVDGTLVDAFAVKVLGTLLRRVRSRGEVTRALAQWRHAESPWQRRAVCVAFTSLAPQGDEAVAGFTQLAFTVCSTIVWSPDRIDQTGVGWLLRELSRAEPTRVEAFVRRHARFMSREAMRHSIEKLPAARQADLLAHWKRATTIRR
jgi:hypothetical protein